MHRDTKQLGILFGTMTFLSFFLWGMAAYMKPAFDAVTYFLAVVGAVAALFSGAVFLLNLLYLDKTRD